MNTRLWVAAGISVIFLTACPSERGTESNPPGSNLIIDILSPSASGVSVTSNRITIEISNSGLASVSATNTTPGASVGSSPQNGILNNDKFYIFNLPLVSGTNSFELVAQGKNGQAVRKVLEIMGSNILLDPIRIRPTPEIGSVPINSTLLIDFRLADTPAGFLVDNNSDGVFDSTPASGTPILASYPNIGSFTPSVTVRTTSNTLYSSAPTNTRAVRALNDTTQNTGANMNIDRPVHDVQVLADGTSYLLQNDRVLIIRGDGSLLREVPLRAIEPRGLFVDQSGNIYIADTGANRVVKLLASSNFNPDTLLGPAGEFGTAGGDPGQLNAPEDVAVVDITGEDTIFVADTGNSRIQRFNRAGIFEEVISTDGGATLVAPSGIAATDSGTLFVVDRGAQQIVVFDRNGIFDGVIGSPGSAPGEFSNPNKISLSPDGLVVTDTGNRRVQIIEPNGVVIRLVNLPLASPGAAGIRPDVSPVELLVVADQVDTSQLSAFNLTQDPPADEPLSIAQRFTDLVATRSFAAARALLAPGSRAGFDQALANTPDALANAARDTRSLVLISSTVVTAIVGGQSNANSVEIVLIRDSATGLWAISSF